MMKPPHGTISVEVVDRRSWTGVAAMDTARPDVLPPAQEPFGALLRRYRLAAGLSQEELAERAGLSVQALSALENGRRQIPYRHTVALLASALGLSAPEIARLEATIVRGRVPASAEASAPGVHNQRTNPDHKTGADRLAPVRMAQSPRTNLPVALTSFIGREREQGEVRALLDATRLVTLTGAGGAGKTRLALAVAGRVLNEFPDGIRLAELAPLADPALAVQAVAAVLELREEPNRPLLATLVAHLEERRLLLVLDNCEHLVAACAELAVALLQCCPHLRILATSRETLEVPGETCYRVPSLAVPDLVRLPDAEHLPTYEAVQLFMQRARSRRPGFTLTAQNAWAIAQVCTRLDGMPLAIELAAARAGTMTVEQIAVRLDDGFRLLTGGPRTAVPRQQTQRATLDWSYDLLALAEQVLLQRLSVFAGGCTVEAVEAVCGEAGIEDTLRVPELLDLLGSLVNKSLVLLEEADPTGEQPRYRLLETVRQYGQERLEASGKASAARERHLRWCLALAEEAEPQLIGPEQRAWLERLEREHDNLRAALGWAWQHPEEAEATEPPDEQAAAPEGIQAEPVPAVTDASMRLVHALWRFWLVCGHKSEGRGWLERMLARDAGTRTGSAASRRATVLWAAGEFAREQGDYARAEELFEASLNLGRILGVGVSRALTFLGAVAQDRGEYERAVSLHEEALRLARPTKDLHMTGMALLSLGDAVRLLGDYERAAACLEEGIVLLKAIGHTWGIALALSVLGAVTQAQGELDRARALYAESLSLEQTIGSTFQTAASMEGLASLAAAQGQGERTARLFGAADALRTILGTPVLPNYRADHDRSVDAVRRALGDDTFAAAWAEGQALPLEAAIALALAVGPAR
jgi:non-specific serine/threonine protein kinase